MGVKKDLEKIRTLLKAAKTEFGKEPPDVKTLRDKVGDGVDAVDALFEVYKKKKAKVRAPLIKARETLKKCVAIIKDGESITIIDLLNEALKATIVAEKVTKTE